MTRLTDAQIDEVWYATPNLRGFVDAIAALAVQEVEREVPLETRTRWAKEFNALAAENATLTAQLAQAQADERLAVANADRMTDEIAGFEAMWEQREKAHDAETEALRAQLATAKREGAREGIGAVMEYARKAWASCVPHREIAAFRDREYPATPSGELCDADCGCQAPEAREGCPCRRPDCPTPSRPAREVPLMQCAECGCGIANDEKTDADGKHTIRGCIKALGKRTPADAKRIVRLAQEAE
jgi:hypothetical protein